MAAGATLSSITITDTSDFIVGVLNASNNWEIEGGNDTKIWFGTNSLGATEGTLALGLAYFITDAHEGTITVQFTFTDGKVETDTLEYAFKNTGGPS